MSKLRKITVYLKTGGQLDGKFIYETETRVVIQSLYKNEEFFIPWRNIDYVKIEGEDKISG